MKTFRRVLFAVGMLGVGLGVTVAGCAERPGKKEDEKKDDKAKKDDKGEKKDDKAEKKD